MWEFTQTHPKSRSLLNRRTRWWSVVQGQGLVVGGELLNGQDRPKDLLLHECIVLLEP